MTRKDIIIILLSLTLIASSLYHRYEDMKLRQEVFQLVSLIKIYMEMTK